MELLHNIITGGVLAGLVVLGIISIGISRRSSGQHTRSSDNLWHELCKVHRLSWWESRSLRRAAEAAGLDPSSLLFVEPHVVQQAIEAAGRKSPRGKQLSRLADHLYR